MSSKLIVLRIKGNVKLAPDIRKTLELLGLKKKFSCIIVDNTKEQLGMLKKVQHCISYGNLDAELLKQMLLKRAKKNKAPAKLDEKKVEEFVKKFVENKATIEELGINKVFSLHPPKGGLKKSSKLLAPKGILGKNEKINELIAKML